MSKNNQSYYKWNHQSFREGYADGFTAFSFLMVPYRPKPVIVPHISRAWSDVGGIMSLAIMEYDQSEEAKKAKA